MLIDPISAWNWQRRATAVIVVLSTAVALAAAGGGSVRWYATIMTIGIIFLVAAVIRFMIWIFPGGATGDHYLPELALLVSGVVLFGLGMAAQTYIRAGDKTEMFVCTQPGKAGAPSFGLELVTADGALSEITID